MKVRWLSISGKAYSNRKTVLQTRAAIISKALEVDMFGFAGSCVETRVGWLKCTPFAILDRLAAIRIADVYHTLPCPIEQPGLLQCTLTTRIRCRTILK
jgi:hypothetical protein